MIMQCTERGESKRSAQEDVSAGNGAISYIQSGITVDEVKRRLCFPLTLTLSLLRKRVASKKGRMSGRGEEKKKKSQGRTARRERMSWRRSTRLVGQKQ